MWRNTTALLAGALLTIAAAGIARGDTLWIDVRSPEEHASDRIEGDPNLPHADIGERIGTITTDHNADIALYCSSGVRSFVAMRKLNALGYQRVRNAGGIEEVRAERGL